MRPLSTMVAAFCGLLLLNAIVLADEEFVRTISVSGSGQVSAPPDMATIQTGVTAQAKTAKEALSQNNQAMAAVMQALKQQQIADKDVQTSNFSVQPMYEHDDRGRQRPQIAGYQVHNQVRVRVRHLARLGEVLDALVQSGSNQISGINFGVDDETGIFDQARSRAIQDAKRRAEVYAQAAGVKVGAVRQINEQQFSPPRPMQVAFARAEAASVPVATGELDFNVSVNVVYTLEEAK